jgi:hypothetical protein
MNWIPALSNTGLLAAALWLARNLILNRMTKSVQHEFDVKLEGVRAQLHNNEEAFRAELRRWDDAISANRSASLSALTANRGVFDKRRIDAVDEILRAIAVLAAGKWAVSQISILKMDAVSAQIEKDPKLAQVFTLMSPNHEKISDDLMHAAALGARPYVSELTWALFGAYQAIILFCVFLISMLRGSFNPLKVVDARKISTLIRSAVAEEWGRVGAFGFMAYPEMLGELEDRFQALRADAERATKDHPSARAPADGAAVRLSQACGPALVGKRLRGGRLRCQEPGREQQRQPSNILPFGQVSGSDWGGHARPWASWLLGLERTAFPGLGDSGCADEKDSRNCRPQLERAPGLRPGALQSIQPTG